MKEAELNRIRRASQAALARGGHAGTGTCGHGAHARGPEDLRPGGPEAQRPRGSVDQRETEIRAVNFAIANFSCLVADVNQNNL